MSRNNLLLQSLAAGLLLGSVAAAPISATAPPTSPTGSGTSAPVSTGSIGSSTGGPSSSRGYLLLNWDTAAPSPTEGLMAFAAPSEPASTSSAAASTTASLSATISTASASASASASPADIRPNAVPASTKTSWALPPTFSNMDPFHVTTYAAGLQNLAVLRGSPVKWTNTSNPHPNEEGVRAAGPSHSEKWDMDSNSLQVLYPNGSINPGNSPQGGAEFYGQPLDLRLAKNTTLQYSVYFPHDFDFVKGGKLPGLYGGHKGCSGGNAAEDCFSTRIMWRQGGKGELYLYAPKDKQTPALCSTPPKSICDSEYGLSIGRGAWTFAAGDWTTIRQDVWLNTPGVNDGGFNIWINGKLVMSSYEVRYRENALACGDKIEAAAAPVNEDWSSLDSDDEVITPQAAESNATFTSASVSTASMTMASISVSSSSTSGQSTATSTITSAVTSSSGSVTSVTSVTSTAASTSRSTSTSQSLSASNTGPLQARATFQTPVQRWLKVARRDQTPANAQKTVTAADFQAESTEQDATTDSTSDPSSTDPSPVGAASDASDASADPAASAAPSDVKLKQNKEDMDALAADALPADDSEAAGGSDDVTGMSESSEGDATPAVPASANDVDAEAEKTPETCGVGFIGLFFSTFFGGHTSDWATPKNQYTYYKDFEMWVTE